MAAWERLPDDPVPVRLMLGRADHARLRAVMAAEGDVMSLSAMARRLVLEGIAGREARLKDRPKGKGKGKGR